MIFYFKILLNKKNLNKEWLQSMDGRKINEKIVQIERVPETIDSERWDKFNERINNLANQGFVVSFVEDRYIVMTREKPRVRLQE